MDAGISNAGTIIEETKLQNLYDSVVRLSQ